RPLHAALVCTGSSPSYFPSGWGPCCLCWGWFLLGAGLSVAGTVVFFSAMPASLLRFGHARPTWHAAAEAVLACVSAGGPAELRGLAAQAGLPAEDLLCQLLREATRFPATAPAGSQQNALARGTGTRRRGGRPPPTEAHVSAERKGHASRIAVRRIQSLVHGQALPGWTEEAAAHLLEGAAAVLVALADGPPARGGSEDEDEPREASRTPLRRSRSRSPISPPPGEPASQRGDGRRAD
ncbi:unnamed protein product, partial [Effrenium voratum]